MSRDPINSKLTVSHGDEYEDEEDIEEDYQVDHSARADIHDAEYAEPERTEPECAALSWTPDRLLVHVLYDEVKVRGMQGTSSMVCNQSRKVNGYLLTLVAEHQGQCGW